MEKLLFATVCCPFSLIATFLNITFLRCLHRPVTGVNLRQPLRFLLIALLCNSTAQQFIVLLTVLLAFLNVPEFLRVAAKALVYTCYCSYFSSTAWISIFYYIKIVPQRFAVFLWIKRHIKVVVYIGFIWDQFILLVAISIGTIPYLLPPPNLLNSTYGSSNENMTPNYGLLNLFLTKYCHIVFTVYLVIPVLTLSYSWCRTFLYLRGHLSQMEQSVGSSVSPQRKSQMRVVVMGLVQTAVFIPSCIWTVFMVLLHGSSLLEKIDADKHITVTVTSISDLANVVCLGFSQSVFRRGIMEKVREGFRLGRK